MEDLELPINHHAEAGAATRNVKGRTGSEILLQKVVMFYNFGRLCSDKLLRYVTPKQQFITSIDAEGESHATNIFLH